MTDRTWSPSPQLATATAAALAAFARHWPRAMALAVDPSEAGRAFIGDYAFALLGCDLAAIPHAASRWLSESATPPRPKEFAVLARAVAQELRPPQYGDSVTKSADVPTLPLTPQDMAHIDHRGRRAYALLGTWRDVGEVWALLWHTCDDDTRRASAVRRGNVPLEVFDEAVGLVRAGGRAPGGPLAGMMP